MTQVLFVEVTTNRLEMQACEIAERTYNQGLKLQIIATDRDQASRLDDLLWTFRPDSFVPHDLLIDDIDGSTLPVIITLRQERAREFAALIMMDFCAVQLVAQFSQVTHFVVGGNQERVQASRRYWAELKEAGFTLRHQKH